MIGKGRVGSQIKSPDAIYVADATARLALTPSKDGQLVVQISDNTVWSWDLGGSTWVSASGTGDLVGPSSATDNAVSRYDGTTGKLVQDSSVTIDDSGNITANDFVGATMDADTSLSGNGYFLDEDDMASDDADKVASQQSIKAYVDGKTYSADSIELNELGTATYDDVQDWSNITQSAGLISGGAVTDGGSGTVDIASGTGILKTSDSCIGANVMFDFAGTTGLALTDGSNNWIYIDYNSGTPTYGAVVDWTSLDLHTQIIIAQVYRDGTNLHFAPVAQVIDDFSRRVMMHSYETLGVHRTSGLITSETGTRNIAISAGTVYAALSRLSLSAFDSSGAGTFTYVYRDGVGGWIYVAAQTQIDNTQYDDGDGTLGTLGANRYGVHWVYRHNDGGVYIQYGQSSYRQSDAEIASVPAAPELVTGFGILIGKIVIQKNSSTFYSISTAFENIFPPVAVSEHNDLGSIQGGTTDEYYHLTSAQHSTVIALTSPEKTFKISPSGGDYTSIQAALTAQTSGGELFLVYPGTYSSDTINFTANNQSVVGVSDEGLVSVTQATSTICNVAAYTGCSIQNLTLSITGATSDCHIVTASTGDLKVRECDINLTNTSNTGSIYGCNFLYATGDADIVFTWNTMTIVDNAGDGASSRYATGFNFDSGGDLKLYRNVIKITANSITDHGIVGINTHDTDVELIHNSFTLSCTSGDRLYGAIIRRVSASYLIVRITGNIFYCDNLGGGTTVGISASSTNIYLFSSYNDMRIQSSAASTTFGLSTGTTIYGYSQHDYFDADYPLSSLTMSDSNFSYSYSDSSGNHHSGGDVRGASLTCENSTSGNALTITRNDSGVADNTLGISVDSGDRTLTIGGNASISNDLTPTADVVFDGLRLSGQIVQRAAYIGTSNRITSSTTTSTELGYVSGVTSAIQTQLDSLAIKTLVSETTVGSVGSVGQINAGHILASDIHGVGSDIAYYKFASGSMTTDQESTYTLTDNGTVLNANGITGSDYAAVFNGTSQYYTQATLLDTMPTNLNISFWLKSASGQPTTQNNLIVKQNAAGEEIQIQHLTTGKIRFYTAASGSTPSLDSLTILPSGATSWYHIVLSWDPTNGKRMWINGVLEAVDSSETTLMTSGTTSDFFIGASTTPSRYLNGTLALLRVGNTVLTQKDVDLLYATKHDISGSSLSNTNFQAWAQIKEDGSDDYLSQIDFGQLELKRTTSALYTYGNTLGSTDKLTIFGRE